MNAEQPNNQTEETPIFYDCREPQKIPLLVPKGNGKVRITHHLKPLTNDRYFQFQNEIEEVAFYEPKELRAIYKPHFDLWNELLIERVGAKESNSDALVFEAAHAIKALLYYEKLETAADPSGEPFLYDDEADCEFSFGAMFSGAWLGLRLDFKSAFDSKTDDYLQATKKVRRWGTTGYGLRAQKPFFSKSDNAEKLYNFALPYVSGGYGYAETGNIAEVVPAWHVVQSAILIHSQTIQFLGDVPQIAEIRGQ